MPVNTFGKGRAVYISGLPYSFENSRVLHRAILWSSSSEDALLHWFSSITMWTSTLIRKTANTAW